MRQSRHLEAVGAGLGSAAFTSTVTGIDNRGTAGLFVVSQTVVYHEPTGSLPRTCAVISNRAAPPSLDIGLASAWMNALSVRTSTMLMLASPIESWTPAFGSLPGAI